MSFKLENFVAAPSKELLNLAKKTDLFYIADHYALTSVKSRKENPQKLTQLSSRSHPRHLVGKKTAQKTSP